MMGQVGCKRKSVWNFFYQFVLYCFGHWGIGVGFDC